MCVLSQSVYLSECVMVVMIKAMRLRSCIMVCIWVRLFVIFLPVTGCCQHIHGKDIWLHVQLQAETVQTPEFNTARCTFKLNRPLCVCARVCVCLCCQCESGCVCWCVWIIGFKVWCFQCPSWWQKVCESFWKATWIFTIEGQLSLSRP